ncbi:hypothetical protein D3C85_1824170 [compost metagenome]
MVTKEELMKENATIMEVLTNRTRNLLNQHKLVFEHSIDILMKEEVLSGDTFRKVLRVSLEKTA